MTTIAPQPKLQFFDANGDPLVGGKLYSYAAGTTTPLATYTNYGGGTTNANPVVLDSRGEASVWLTPSSRYKLRLTTATDADVWTVDDVGGADQGTLAALAASGGASLVGYDQTASATAGTVAERLKTELVTTGLASLQAAVTAAAGKRLYVVGTHTITASVTVLSNTEIILTPGSIVQTSTSNIHHFDCTGRTGVVIRGPGKLLRTAAGSSAYYGGVAFINSTDCRCEGVEMDGMQWSGVYMSGATRCHAAYNYIHDHTGASIQDSAGVHMIGNCADCSADHNNLVNTGWEGVSIQGIGSGTVPLRCSATNNNISGVSAYGVLVYQIDPADTFSTVANNTVRNVTGTNPSGSGGAGIYVQSSGAVRVANNMVRNVCTASSNNTLTPAGIGVNNIGTSLTKPVIEGNTIIDVGINSSNVANSNAVTVASINVSSSGNGANIGPNTMHQTVATSTATYVGVYVNAASRVSITGQTMVLPTTGNTTGMFFFANGTNLRDITITGGNIRGGAQNYVRFQPAASETIQSVSISGLVCTGGATSLIGLQMQNLSYYSVAGCQFETDQGNALNVSACQRGTYSANRFETLNGSVAVSTSGTCTHTNMDASNFWGVTYSLLSNAATGFRVEWYGVTASPATGSGTGAVGDRAIRIPVIGSPVAWSCTTAGTPGAWHSEGNL